jgi:release factor glutamine methyltransferase
VTDRVWTMREALDWTLGYFERAGVEKPRLSAEWLLSAATGLSRVELYAYHDRPLSPEERAALRASIERRAKGEPLQYVTGEMPFRHLVLRVRPGVFIPRPETEVLVDVALETLGPGSPVVVDLCTGSGAVAVSIAHETPSAVVYATDLDPAAVALARENAERAGVADRVTVLEGDLFAPLPRDLRGRVALVVANPPYVPSAEVPALPADVLGYEPHLALDGGPDGLDVARRIMAEAREWLAPSCVLSVELDAGRVMDAAKDMRAWYEGVRTCRDLAGRDRIVTGRTQEARS